MDEKDKELFKDTFKKLNGWLNEIENNLNSVSNILLEDMKINDSNIETAVGLEDVKTLKNQLAYLRRWDD